MKNFNELSGLELDTLREIGSIGTGNAATALSSLLQCEVRIEMPEVRILGYNEAIDWIGGPEVITAGVLVRLGGEINGIMLSVQQMDFINQVLGRMMNRTVCEYGQLSELDRSALVEVGNIMISTFVNALSGLAGVTIQPSVPGFAVDMQGAILTVPMALRVIRIAETLSASAETRGIDLKRRKSNYLSLDFSAWDIAFLFILAISVAAGFIL